MNKKKIFKLFAHCIPVKGAKRFVICDIQRNDIYFVNEELYDMLTKYKDYSLEEVKALYDNEYDVEIEQNLDYLIKHELGFYTEESDLFLEINHHWERPESITNAIIEWGKSSTYSMKSVIDQLELLGCKQIELRFYDTISSQKLIDTLRLFEDKRIRNIYLYVKYAEDINLDFYQELLLKYQRLGQINIHSCPENFRTQIEKNKFSEHIKLTCKNIVDNSHCGIVNERFFLSNQDLFFEALNFNSCLHRKISIGVDGIIKNCPSMADAYGNIKDTTLEKVLCLSEFKQHWSITKDVIHVCKDCEFRYICVDCRAYIENPTDIYSKPLKCGYNPYTTEWSEWSTNPIKQRAIEYYELKR